MTGGWGGYSAKEEAADRDECEHGSLRRKCDICALTAERESLRAEVERLRDDRARLRRAADLLDAGNEAMTRVLRLAKDRYPHNDSDLDCIADSDEMFEMALWLRDLAYRMERQS